MENTELIHQLNVILLLVLYLSAPVLGVAAAVAVVSVSPGVTPFQNKIGD